MQDSLPILVPEGRRQPKATMATKLYRSVRDSVLSGELAPGAKLSLQELQKVHDVSLSPLREALSRLIATGLVELEDQRGYRIPGVSAENLREIVTLRSTAETLALRLSIQNGDLDWESRVQAALHRLGRAGQESGAAGADTWTDAHRRFHLALVSNCRMPMLQDLCERFLDLNLRYELIFGVYPASRDAILDIEHSAIAEAAIARDADTAVPLLEAHIKRIGAVLMQKISAAPARARS